MIEEMLGKDMSFWTFEEFFKKRYHIKEVLAEKYNTDMKYFAIYRLYVEAQPWIKEYYRDCIWTWLNDYMTNEEFVSVYMKHRDEMRRKQAKMKKDDADEH